MNRNVGIPTAMSRLDDEIEKTELEMEYIKSDKSQKYDIQQMIS